MSNFNESKINNDSGSLKGKCVETRTTLISGRYRAFIRDYIKIIIGSTPKISERPNLSKNTIDWIKSVGLNPENMSNEQLAVFAEIDDHKKSNWAVRFLYGTSFVFLILAFFNLIGLDFVMLGINVLIAFIVWYVGHKIQMNRVSKKFHEASIMKFAQEQSKTNKKTE